MLDLLIKYRYPVLLTGIIILGGILRFYEIGERCLHADAVTTIKTISQGSLREVFRAATQVDFTQLPLYYILLYKWSMFDKSIFWLRSFSAIFGVFLILVSYALTKVLFNRKTALLTVYFVAISPFLVLFSRVVRYYSLKSFLVLLSMYLFIRAMREGYKAKWLSYIVVKTMALYVSYSSFLFFLPETLFIFFYRKKYPLSPKRWLISVAVILFLWAPMASYLLRDLGIILAGEGYSHIPIKIGWIGNLLYFFVAFSLGQTILPFNYPVIIIGVLTYGYIIFNFFRVFLSKKINHESAIFVVFTLFIVTILCSLLNYNLPRYIKCVAVFFSIIISLGILSLPKRKAILLVILITSIRFCGLYNLYHREDLYHKQELVDKWDDTAFYVNENSSYRDVVIYTCLTFEYYMNDVNAQKTKFMLPQNNSIEDTQQLISKYLEDKPLSQIILVESPLSGFPVQFYQDELALLRVWLREHNFTLIATKNFDRDRWVYQKRRFLDREFPEYRTTVYIYAKEADKINKRNKKRGMIKKST